MKWAFATLPVTKGNIVMAERDLLHEVLSKAREHRYSESSRYLTDIVASLALGGRQ